jgi:hypothetical protein
MPLLSSGSKNQEISIGRFHDFHMFRADVMLIRHVSEEYCLRSVRVRRIPPKRRFTFVEFTALYPRIYLVKMLSNTALFACMGYGGVAPPFLILNA